MRLLPLRALRALFCLPLLWHLVSCGGVGDEAPEEPTEFDFLYAHPEENDPVMELFPATVRLPMRGDFRTSVMPKMVEFYNPYCGACQAYKPNYLKLARALKKQAGQNMEFYAVSCLVHKEICDAYDAQDVPLVGLFQEGSTNPQLLRKLKVPEKNPEFVLSYLFPEKESTNQRALEETGEDQDSNEEINDGKEENDNNGEDEEKAGEEDGNEDNEEGNEDSEGNEDKEGGNEDNEEGNEDNDDGNETNEKGEDEEAAGAGEGDGAADGDGEDGESEENGDGGDGEGDGEVDGGAEQNEPGEDEEGDGVVTENHEKEDDDSGDEGEGEGDGDTEEAEEVEQVDGDGGDEDGEEEPDEDGEEEPDEEEGSGDNDHKMADVEEANRQWFNAMENDLESKSRSKPSPQHAKPGAKMKDSMVSDMDRFGEAMAQLTGKNKLASLLRREPLGTHAKRLKAEKIDGETGATYAMRAHTPGTPEYEARQKQVKSHMANLMRKQRLRTTAPERTFSGGVGGAARFDLPANHKPVMPYTKQVQKLKLAHDIVGKVPIVRRMVKLSHEEELILDASLSFITALKVGLFENSDQLPKSKKRAFQTWLDLLRISLPPEWALHELIMDLDNNLDFISQKEQNLQKFLKRHELPRQQWSRSCTKNGRVPQNGFNCGFWKLLHVASVGIAEHRGGLNLVDANLVSKEVRVFSPLEAADAMKDFIANFFPCAECRNHFVADYDECSNRRCVRLSHETDDATFADWQELSKWLWEVHNDVNVRLFREQSTKRDLSIHDDISVLYPSLESCISCFLDDGRFDEDGIFLYLEKEYWPGASDIDPASDKLLTFHNVEYVGAVSSWAILFMAVGVIYMLRPKGVFKAPKKRSE